MAPDSEPPAPGLHRSCIFCRARKIRCSGGTICTACRERNINCIYSPEARKGRPRRRGASSSDAQGQPRKPQRRRLVSSPPSPAGAASPAASGPVTSASAGASRAPSPQPVGGDADQTLGHELEQMFHEYFIRKNGSRSNLFQDSIASFQRHMRKPSPGHTSPRPKLSYDGMLSFLAHEMVEILLLRFGQLGCEQPESTHQYFYIASLAEETTPSMFDPARRQRGPLAALGKHRVVQMVHLWFMMHPLSPLVSKTLLLDAIQDETVDEALLAVILADAFQAFDSSDGQSGSLPEESPQLLAHFAASQLRHRPLSQIDTAPISTVQALILLGWRDLAQGLARRSTCYIGYTCRIISRQYQRRNRSDGGPESMKLNGIDIGQVDQEILQNIYWLCLSTTTWAFMQIDQPFTLLLPDEIPDFPSLDETTSAALRLDRASNNISTLPSQVQAMRWLWPLSHITSTVAHIYTIYLNAPTEERKVKAAPWHIRHIHQLHQLLRARFEPSNLSFEVRAILIQAIKLVEREVTTPHTQFFLLTSYYTIIVHMLFSPEQRAPPPVTPSTIQALGECISAVLAIAAGVPSLPASPVPTQASYGNRALALCLDACSRALVRLHNQCQHNWQQTETRNPIPGLTKLAEHAERAHNVCKSDFLGQHASILRPAKKRLKWVKSALHALASPSTSTSSISDINEMANAAFLSLTPPTNFPLPFDRTGDLDLPLGSSTTSLSDLMPPYHLPPPLEIPDPGFFCDDPALDSLLGFPGIARAADIYPRASDSSSSHMSLGTPPSAHDGRAFGVEGDMNTATSASASTALADLFFLSPDLNSPGLEGLLMNGNPFGAVSNPAMAGAGTGTGTAPGSGSERIAGGGGNAGPGQYDFMGDLQM
ncbi:hypothetical protein ASPVEDRAFT_32621 [Aspergillus versicolor CBS 583.65]|uniref:Zn(2)-C6 fungal-type domain-containing protein n=1 Tax=Aspergillus versicolor CBS 583.65 TaxID=1036611 RepID=A0A1L9PXQ3_ASPVE|nr:uncharacterized protein ASPVEDRAFT_32621 [Aspergillus versicolor CBS 583.65]OJJ06314.1 hypothetical protein ASPVEDRAFT_32621 [Aspergillus versicolor CBS 583.65]